MSLPNLRANLNTASDQDCKHLVIEKFESKNPGKHFYTYNLSEELKSINPDVHEIDSLIRQNLLNDMLIADVLHLGLEKKVVGGLYFGDLVKLTDFNSTITSWAQKSSKNITKKAFVIQQLELRDEGVEQMILQVLQSVMKTPTVDL